jgi:hypothetical protein
MWGMKPAREPLASSDNRHSKQDEEPEVFLWVRLAGGFLSLIQMMSKRAGFTLYRCKQSWLIAIFGESASALRVL